MRYTFFSPGIKSKFIFIKKLVFCLCKLYQINILLLFLLFFIATPSFSQVYLRQTIRGTVTERQTGSPLPGAIVILSGTNPLIGTSTDSNGVFKLNKVPVGKYQLNVTFLGYAPYLSEVFSVNSGKETMMTIELNEMVYTSKEIEVKAFYKKNESINKMATVSIRSFNTDETNRYAGSYGDPARMAANFAGVTSGIDNRNDIIVRGNSPMGLQWRIDGMEIPNPNHFAAVGTTGGPVTVINDNLLTNSDFLTGAFPAQFGNTIAGIFDMKMRTGNNEKQEYWGQIGWNGLELGAEGPFSKKSGATYIMAYRYSLLDIVNSLGMKLTVVPKYQDLNFKLIFPTKKAGTFQVVGIGGLSYIELYDSKKKQGSWTFPAHGEDLSNGSDIGTLGVSNICFLTKTLRLNTNLYVVGSRVYTRIDTFSIASPELTLWAGENSSEWKYSFSTQIVKKFSVKNTIESGLYLDWYHMHFTDSIRVGRSFHDNTNFTGDMQLIRAYTQWQHRFSDFFTMTGGIYYQHLTLNNSMSLEPRFGFDWIFDQRHSLNFGAGLYSQMQPRVIYFVQAQLPDGSYEQSNRSLGFTRSGQVAGGYNYLLSQYLRFKLEAYYQYLYSIPVKASIPPYSLINQGHEFFVDRQYSDSLVNQGTGENYGLELTFERFFNGKYFYLLTASLFNSTYNAFDNINRSTSFNGNYVLNAIGGYEFRIGKRKLGILSIGLRATWAGGDPYIPFNVDETIATGRPVPYWQHAFNSRYPEYKRVSVRFGIKRNRKNLTMEFMLDLQYRTNYTNIYLQRIDVLSGQVYNYFKMGFFPMGTWRIQF
ncbi:MAG: TonB-dependent receptor [Bacteroidetes bacterium]|nr:TonB-dependent receptor [Bacteroidota bacterium]